MDEEQVLRDFQRQYLDFLDDNVRPTPSPSLAGTHTHTAVSVYRRTRECTMRKCGI